MNTYKLKTYTRKEKIWTERELLDLATGLQKYGLSDTEKLSKLIGTKDETAVKYYIELQMVSFLKEYKVEKKQHKSTHGKPHMVRVNAEIPEEMKDWPPVRKWNLIARNQITAPSLAEAKRNYSKLMIQDICREFYEEAEETTHPQIIDVKAIYKFLLDCVSGRNPAELKPKESAVVLMLLRKLRELKISLDLDEEKNFISSFKKAPSFKPFKVKDESESGTTGSEATDPDAVPIDDEVYKILTRHQRLIQSFNPLMVPLWFLDKEQSLIFEKLNLQKENTEENNETIEQE